MITQLYRDAIDRWAGTFLVLVLSLTALVAVLNLALPPSSPIHVPTYVVALLGKYLCYAVLALALDLVSPWLVARHTAAVPPHPEHLPERFGLFTIILLGEGMASVVHALDHGDALHRSGVAAAAVGALLTFALWLAYFDLVRGHGERHVATHAAGRRMRLWAYGHVPLYMGIASLAAGTVALAAPGALTARHAIMYLGGLMLAGAGLLLLRRADPGQP